MRVAHGILQNDFIKWENDTCRLENQYYFPNKSQICIALQGCRTFQQHPWQK